MKTHIKFFRTSILIALMLLCFPILNSVHAQTDRPARMDQTSKAISLDENIAFGHIYYLDIKNMDFPSRVDAKKYFRPFNTPFVSFTVHFEEKVVNIELDLRAKNDWTIKDWNTYLSTITAKK